MRLAEREEVVHAELHVFFANAAFSSLLTHRRTRDLHQLFDFASIALVTAGAILTQQVATESDEARDLLAQFGVVYPRAPEYEHAARLAKGFSLSPTEALDIACAARLASDGFIFVGATDNGQVAAEALGLGYHRPADHLAALSSLPPGKDRKRTSLGTAPTLVRARKVRDALHEAQKRARVRHAKQTAGQTQTPVNS